MPGVCPEKRSLRAILDWRAFHGISELRLHPILIATASVLVAACATPPAPHVELIDPPPPVVIAPEPPPLILELIKPQAPAPFAAAAMADLEPLPPPVFDLWERIIAGYEIPDLEGPLVE